MKTNWKAEFPILAVLAAMWGIAAWAWDRIPGHIPVHFGANGAVDRFGGRSEGLLVLPAVASVAYALLLVWPSLDPRKERFAQFARPYAIVRLTVFTLFLVIHVAAVAIALGREINIGVVISAAEGLAIVLLGNYLPKIQPNWIVGVRTPWTLSSDVSWRQTHRLAGPLCVASGVLTLITVLVRPEDATYVMLASLLLTALICAVYSYLIWRRDPISGPSCSENLRSRRGSP